MSTKTKATAEKTPAERAGTSKKDAAAIEKNKPQNAASKPETDKPEPTAKGAKAGPQPKKSAGVASFCRNSHRETEVFEAKDVVFFREGPAATIQAIPRHEAEERFVEVLESEDQGFDHGTGSAKRLLKLKGGDSVTIEGAKVTITTKKDGASSDGPSLNVHHADVQG